MHPGGSYKGQRAQRESDNNGPCSEERVDSDGQRQSKGGRYRRGNSSYGSGFHADPGGSTQSRSRDGEFRRGSGYSRGGFHDGTPYGGRGMRGGYGGGSNQRGFRGDSGGGYRGRMQGGGFQNVAYSGRGGAMNSSGNVPAVIPTMHRDDPIDKDDLSTWHEKHFRELVRSFVESDSQELAFPPSVTPKQRHTLHRIAAAFNLMHKSSGAGDQRALTLFKTKTADAIDAAANNVRVKIFEGYQGAQPLPHIGLTDEKADEVVTALTPYQLSMYRDLKVEANRPSAAAKRFNSTQPGTGKTPNVIQDKRYEELQRFRHALPTYKHRDEIVNAVRHNDVVIVSGETGSGKTTQIPQMLYDAKVFPKNETIICTQPRRISAISVAQRVATERGEACGGTCGYVIRFENVTSSHTRLVYETTGILLRRLHGEPELRGVACVIVDEVHERDLETDFCLLLLRDRLLAQRRDSSRFPQKLKVVVMSATAQIDTLVAYFSECNAGNRVPLIRIPGTLYPVQEYFLEDAISWVGTEADSVAARLVAAAKVKCGAAVNGALCEGVWSEVMEASDQDLDAILPYDLIRDLIVHFHKKDRDMSGSILVFLPGWAAITMVQYMLLNCDVAHCLHVLTLHSKLVSANQYRVFEPAPPMKRKVVLATNIAETSITIDDIAFVIDSCLMKGTVYNAKSSILALQSMLIGKSNGVQRRGRAGRCRRGTCVHLLPRRMYDDLPFAVMPEIMRSPLEEICLQIKAIQEDELCSSVLSRALDAPPPNSVRNATEFLTEMGAFTAGDERLTNLGRALAQLPVHPLLGKMLLAGACFGVLDSIATIAAGLSVRDIHVPPVFCSRKTIEQVAYEMDGGTHSDHLRVLKTYREWIASERSDLYVERKRIDKDTMNMLDKMKQQLERLVLRSPLLHNICDAQKRVNRHQDNVGLIRLVLLWGLSPRLATVEYLPRSVTPHLYRLDGKRMKIPFSSVLNRYKRSELCQETFAVFFGCTQLQNTLTMFDASFAFPVDVALCMKKLAIQPLEEVPTVLLQDQASMYVPTFEIEKSLLEDKSGYSALLFDGDKKLYVTTDRVADVLRMARECMDYYLALSIKKLCVDALPEEMVAVLGLLIGSPLTADKGVFAAALTGSTVNARLKPKISITETPCSTVDNIGLSVRERKRLVDILGDLIALSDESEQCSE